MTDSSGSRWEPTGDHITEPIATPAAAAPAPRPRRIGRLAAGAALLAAATLAGGATGMALVGDRADVAEQGVTQPVQQPAVGDAPQPPTAPQWDDDEDRGHDRDHDDRDDDHERWDDR